MPKTIVARHCDRLSRQLCRSARANSTAKSPETRNRSAKALIGGASATIIRAEVKADDHIAAKASPIMIARKSMCLV